MPNYRVHDMLQNMRKCSCGSESILTYKMGHHVRNDCGECGKFIEFVRQPIENFVMPIGQYKGRSLADVPRDYLVWCSQNLKKNLAERIKEFLDRE